MLLKLAPGGGFVEAASNAPAPTTNLLLNQPPACTRADTHRWRVGLQPFPKPVPPPGPASEERVKEILADPRVQVGVFFQCG